LLEAYRLDPNPATSSDLLDRLGPWLTSARRRLVAAPPYLDDEDIAQHLVVEVLRTAGRWWPGCEDNWIARRLVEDAERGVRQRLRRERTHLSEELTDDLPAQQTEPDLLFETPIGRATAADLQLIYRVRVLGEPVAKMAQKAGVSPRRMRQLVREAIARAASGTRAAGGVE